MRVETSVRVLSGAKLIVKKEVLTALADSARLDLPLPDFTLEAVRTLVIHLRRGCRLAELSCVMNQWRCSWAAIVLRLRDAGFLQTTLISKSGALATSLPFPGLHRAIFPNQVGGSVRLCEFTCLRPPDLSSPTDTPALWMLESPRATGRILLHAPFTLTLIRELHKPAGVGRLKTIVGSDPRRTGLFAMLDDAGFLRSDESSQQDGWTFHELMFHARTRQRIAAMLTGRSERCSFKRAHRQVPRIESTVELERDTKLESKAALAPLGQVLQARRSQAPKADHPISIGELATLLKLSFGRASCHPHSSARHSMPYPSAGAFYAAAPYLSVDSCRGLAPGIYQYVAENHTLHRFQTEENGWSDIMTQWGDRPGPAPGGRPQVVLHLVADLSLIAAKYPGLMYSLLSKETGAIIQTLHLVGAALNLSVCALGSGSSDLFEKATGLNYYEHPCIGEVLLSGRSVS